MLVNTLTITLIIMLVIMPVNTLVILLVILPGTKDPPSSSIIRGCLAIL